MDRFYFYLSNVIPIIGDKIAAIAYGNVRNKPALFSLNPNFTWKKSFPLSKNETKSESDKQQIVSKSQKI